MAPLTVTTNFSKFKKRMNLAKLSTSLTSSSPSSSGGTSNGKIDGDGPFISILLIATLTRNFAAVQVSCCFGTCRILDFWIFWHVVCFYYRVVVVVVVVFVVVFVVFVLIVMVIVLSLYISLSWVYGLWLIFSSASLLSTY